MENLKHKQFCDTYLINGLNATQAYITVYKTKNEESARKASSLLLTKIDIKNYIQTEQNKLSKKADIDKEFIINEYKELLESCKEEGLDGSGNIKDRTNWNKALQNLSKMLGFNEPEKIEHSGNQIVTVIKLTEVIKSDGTTNTP